MNPRRRSTSESRTLTLNTYDANGKTIHVVGSGVQTSNDGFGNITNGITVQEYDDDLLAATGQSRVKYQTSRSTTTNRDGSTGYQYVLTTNVQDLFSAEFQSATAEGFSKNFDGYQGYTIGHLSQTFENVNGQAKIKTNNSGVDDGRPAAEYASARSSTSTCRTAGGHRSERPRPGTASIRPRRNSATPARTSRWPGTASTT